MRFESPCIYISLTIDADVSASETVGEALRCAQQRHYDVLVSDIGLPDGNGAISRLICVQK